MRFKAQLDKVWPRTGNITKENLPAFIEDCNLVKELGAQINYHAFLTCCRRNLH